MDGQDPYWCGIRTAAYGNHKITAAIFSFVSANSIWQRCRMWRRCQRWRHVSSWQLATEGWAGAMQRTGVSGGYRRCECIDALHWLMRTIHHARPASSSTTPRLLSLPSRSSVDILTPIPHPTLSLSLSLRSSDCVYRSLHAPPDRSPITRSFSDLKPNFRRLRWSLSLTGAALCLLFVFCMLINKCIYSVIHSHTESFENLANHREKADKFLGNVDLASHFVCHYWCWMHCFDMKMAVCDNCHFTR